MVELVVADVDVFATVFPQGKAKALARAPQPGGNQLRVFPALDAVFNFLHHPKLDQTIHTDPQLLLLGFLAKAKRLFQLGDGQGFFGGKLVEQVGDRELHRLGQLVGGGPPREAPKGAAWWGIGLGSLGSERCPRPPGLCSPH